MKGPGNTKLEHRIRRIKAALLAVSLTFAGVLLMGLSSLLANTDMPRLDWLATLPLGELGGTLFGAGVLGTLFEYSFRKDQEVSNMEQFRSIIKEQAPVMRDAVIEGFAIHPDDLKRVANPELLDDIASNVMALRLGDRQFAEEIYRDIRDQAIRAVERWHDVDVQIRLSGIPERSTGGAPLFDVTVEWEYTTIPFVAVRRLMSVSDRAEYNEVRDDAPATQAWFMTPRPGIDASSRDSYELLEFSVDGEPLKIRRSVRKSGQTYSVDLGSHRDAVTPVRIRQVFRTRTPKWGHRLYFELPQPARGFSVSLDYTNTDIAHMNVSDTVAGTRAVRQTRTPKGAVGREVSIEGTGWYMPKTGFSFSWTLESELPRDAEAREAA